MNHRTDIAIIGGGVIGLSIAYRLAGEGLSVTVVDAGLTGQASYAAAGMLAPFGESGGPGHAVDHGLRSLGLYPLFVQELHEASGIDPELDGPGMLRVARTEQEERALCHEHAWQCERGLPLQRLSGEEARQLEPTLSPDIRSAVLSPAERHVTPRLFLAALRESCQRRGVVFWDNALVHRVHEANGRVDTVSTSQGDISTGEVILAMGAWSGCGALFPEISDLPVRPVKGQILALGPFSTPPIQYTIYTRGAYLVPRRDGRIILGATEEPGAGFDTANTDEGLRTLLDRLKTLVPALADARIESRWSGLRPITIDGLPLIGRLPDWHNVHIATGHGRNGILLTPITAALIADSLLNNIATPEVYAPDRLMEAECAPSY